MATRNISVNVDATLLIAKAEKLSREVALPCDCEIGLRYNKTLKRIEAATLYNDAANIMKDKRQEKESAFLRTLAVDHMISAVFDYMAFSNPNSRNLDKARERSLNSALERLAIQIKGGLRKDTSALLTELENKEARDYLRVDLD